MAAKPGDVAIAKMADPVARACILPNVASQFLVVADCIKLTPDTARFDSRFVVYAINSRGTRFEAEIKSSGTTRLRINLSVLKTVHICAPCLPEQRAIVEILDTLDEAIRQTEQIIAKLKQIKQGLLHDLLTRGIDENGELRDPVRSPEQFKGSPLGRIPVEWEVQRLSEIAAYQNGTVFPSSEYGTEGIELLRPGNLWEDDFIVWDEAHTTRLPVIWTQRAPGYVVGPREIIMNLTAQSLEEGFLGRVCMTPIGTCCLLNQRLARFKTNKLHTGFLFWTLKSSIVRGQIDRLPQGTKVQHLYNRNLNELLLPLPGRREEQVAVSGMLFTISERFACEKDQASKIRLLKQGLMEDLLTGRVRVTNLEAAA